MKNFLTGLCIGLPLGMLLGSLRRGNERTAMAEHMRQIWMEARERAAAVASQAERGRRAVQEEMSGIGDDSGRNVSELLDRQATQARERASTISEAGMERASEAVLNRVSREELLAVYGIGPVLADRIVEARPYRFDREVVERGILNESTFDQLRRQLLERYRKSA